MIYNLLSLGRDRIILALPRPSRSEKSVRGRSLEPMKPFSTLLVSLLLGAGMAAQNPAGTAKLAARAAIEGIVTKDPEGEPVKKALIELIAENQAEGGDYTAISGADGTFRIEDILPGRYHLFAERTGFLETDKNHGRSNGRVLTLTGGQSLRDLHIRLQAAAVVRGRVTDEDGDPLPNAEVSVLRQTFVSGHNHWEQVDAQRTNDLGEYRIANLAAGNVYVSVVPPPDFKTLIEQGGVAGESRSTAAEKPATSYQTTYYPGTTDRSQAAPIQLHAGDDFPIDFTLLPSPSLSIRGTVVNVPPRASASIMLQSLDFGLVLNGAEMHKDGSFVIRDVSPGNYTILATVDGAPVPMTARQTLQIAASNVEGLRLAPQPGAMVRGRLRLESRSGVSGFDPDKIFLALQAMDGQRDPTFTVGESFFSNITHVAADGSFQWTDVPAGSYYVQMAGENGAGEGWYLKAATASGRDVNDSGMSVNGGVVVMDVVASANGAVVEGTIADHKGGPVANAVVVAVPEVRMRGRTDRYRKTVSDQSGHFNLRGLRPGEYTLLAWESVDGEAYYNPEFLKVYEGRGSGIRVSEGERKSMQIEVIADNEE